MKIGIDLDEILADFLSALIEYHNNTYGTNLKKKQFHSYQFWKVWGGTRQEAIQKVYDFHKTTYYKSIKPIDGSKKAINILKQDNDLFIITSRQDDVIDITKEWVAKNFPNIFSDIYFTNHYSKDGDEKTKKDICNSIDIDILIEDSLDYALECIKPERKILLLNYSWNQTSNLPKEIQRVYSWEEIVKYIKKHPVK